MFFCSLIGETLWGGGNVGIESKNSRQTIFVVVVAAAVVLLVLIWVGDTTIRINTKWRRSNKLCEISQFFNTSLTLGWPSRMKAPRGRMSRFQESDMFGGILWTGRGIDAGGMPKCWSPLLMLGCYFDCTSWLSVVGRDVGWRKTGIKNAHDQVQVKLQSDFFALLDLEAHPLTLSQSFQQLDDLMAWCLLRDWE